MKHSVFRPVSIKKPSPIAFIIISQFSSENKQSLVGSGCEMYMRLVGTKDYAYEIRTSNNAFSHLLSYRF